MHEQNESQPKAFIKILFALFTALLVVVLGYLCIQIYTIFHRTYKTETAIAYTMSDNITLKGVAVFQAVDVPGSGNLGYVVQDGERVSAGTILAEQYTDDSQGAMRERLDRLDRAILLLTKSENSSGSDLSVLTTQTRTALYNLLDQIDTASYGAIQDAAEDFLLAQNKLQISTGQAAGFGEVLASLQAERDGIAAQLNGLQTIEADTNGCFVSSESAAPVVRDPTELDAMSPAELLKAAAKRVSADTEKLTRRNMKESVSEFIQTKCIDDLDFARLTMHPRKSMIHCFQYISRKSWDYVQDELKANGVQPGPGQQAYGCDIPDDLCYQWAEDYFRDPDARRIRGMKRSLSRSPIVGKHLPSPFPRRKRRKEEQAGEEGTAEKKRKPTMGRSRWVTSPPLGRPPDVRL